MHTETCDLLLEPQWAGRKVKITARWRGDAVHMDTFDPTIASQRARFITALKEKVPAADHSAIEAELLRVADRPPVQSADDAGPGEVPDDPELLADVEDLLCRQDLLQRVLD